MQNNAGEDAREEAVSVGELDEVVDRYAQSAAGGAGSGTDENADPVRPSTVFRQWALPLPSSAIAVVRFSG